MTLIVLIVWVLAVARATRLINADRIASVVRLYPATRLREATLRAEEAQAHGRTEETRAQLARRERWATVFEFVQCPWCVGMWFALLSAWAPMVLLGWFDRPWWASAVVYVALALAASHIVGICARFADTEEIEITDADDD